MAVSVMDARSSFAPLSRASGNGQTVCLVCPRQCHLQEGQVGWCGVRVARDGVVLPVAAQSYAATGTGPIEEYTLFHYAPGMRVLAVGCLGCSAACRSCQNWELSQVPRRSAEWHIPPLFSSTQAVVERAVAQQCGAIVATCNEPTVWIESLVELSVLAHAAGLEIVLVTNGFLTATARRVLLPHLDVVRLDLKGWDEPSTQSLAGISLEPVLAMLPDLREAGIWHEVSTVILPGFHDTRDSMASLIALLQQHTIGRETPWHLMRAFPAYQMMQFAHTDLAILQHIRQQANAAGLAYVYISNIPGVKERSSLCPQCHGTLAVRSVRAPIVLPSRCPVCGYPIAGRGLHFNVEK